MRGCKISCAQKHVKWPRLKPFWLNLKDGCVFSCSEWCRVSSLSRASCADGVWNGWKPGMPDLHLWWSTSYKHQQGTPHMSLSWSGMYSKSSVYAASAPVVEKFFSSASGNPCHASACSVCRTSSCGGVHHFSDSGKLCRISVYAATASVVECISPAPAVSYAAPAPVVECISPAPAVYVAPSSIVEYIASPTAGHAGLHLLWSTPCQHQQLHLLLSTSRLRRWNLSKQLFTRSYAMMRLMSFATWYV